VVLHAPTDDERYLARPRWAPLVLTPLGWGLGGLVAGLALTMDSPIQDHALALHASILGPGLGDGLGDGAMPPVPVLNVAGVVVFAIGGFLAGLASSLITDLIDGVPKIGLGGLVHVTVLVLWVAALALQGLTGVPVAAPVIGALYGWMRSRGFGPLSRKLQAGAWLAFCALSALVLSGIMLLRPDLGMVALYP